MNVCGLGFENVFYSMVGEIKKQTTNTNQSLTWADNLMLLNNLVSWKGFNSIASALSSGQKREKLSYVHNPNV